MSADDEPSLDLGRELVQVTADGATSVVVEQRALGEGSQTTTTFVASTDAEDRALDVVRQDWRLRNWRSNPVILDNHDHSRVVGTGTGTVPRAGDDAGRLVIEVSWDLDSPDPSVRNVGHQHLRGIRRAGSVGFRSAKKTERSKLPADHQYYREPIEVETWWGGTIQRSGWLYEGNELLEFSSATIPMNPEALQRAVTRAADDIAEIFQRPDVIEQVRRSLGMEAWLLEQLRTSTEVRRILRAHELADRPEPATNMISFAARVARALETSR